MERNDHWVFKKYKLISPDAIEKYILKKTDDKIFFDIEKIRKELFDGGKIPKKSSSNDLNELYFNEKEEGYEDMLYFLMTYLLKLRGMSSRKMEKDLGKYTHFTYQQHIKKGRTIFKKFYQIMKEIHFELEHKQILDEEFPEDTTYSLLLLGLLERNPDYKEEE